MKESMLSNRRGVSLVLLALSIIVLFGFGALAIDVGHLYNVKNQLQVSADAAALAGVKALAGGGYTQTAARNQAMRVASANVADVAYNDDIPGVSAGQPIPVTLLPNQADGDIVVGSWSGPGTFTPASSPTTGSVNAVQVTVRRTGDIDTQPRVQNWLARVFALLPGSPDFSLASVSAVAIAAKRPLEVLPIAVNEYWDEDGWNGSEYPAGKPYGQRYPESFMRGINADAYANPPANPATPPRGGYVFAVLGMAAESNEASYNANSYVDMLFRNAHHSPHPDEWYEVVRNTTTGECGSNCDNNLSPRGVGNSVKNGDVNPTKFDEEFGFLFTGIPDDLIPPNAVREIVRSAPGYTYNNYTTSMGNDPGTCPFSTIPYFTSSGNVPTLPKGPNKMTFSEKWPKGTRFLVMVYDGTHTVNNPALNSQANVVTIVGYGVIEIDGYLTGKGALTSSYVDANGNLISPLDTKGNTAYGHAVPHGLTGAEPGVAGVADVSDPYIIQPLLDPPPTSLPSSNQGSCAFTDLIGNVAETLGSAHLVDESLKYGVQ